ncbi:hypothetical protein BN890_28200 [Bacteroides xylanisolvens SD CC 1b]|uniref:Uncharacterized protein n=1 Tax=Bacteroides xylanisolvens SD CC 1b TaxID=702447 RepID=W6P579_9BACE|nr:hypothetical protein BN890_28200 [Bacteroides xylanisolvens SD CC 1b]
MEGYCLPFKSIFRSKDTHISDFSEEIHIIKKCGRAKKEKR